MVMLTKLLRFNVEDVKGRRAPLDDLCIALLEDDYPPVTHVLFRFEGKARQSACPAESPYAARAASTSCRS